MATISLSFNGRQVLGQAPALRSRAYYDKKFAVTKRFQIEEMVHQDKTGVVFRSWDTERQRPVAVRRFFLEKKVNEVLAKTIGGQSQFSRGLERLKSLEIPRLRRVVGGGLDEVDHTPFLVTDWWEGINCSGVAKEAGLTAKERQALEDQSRELLKALPSDLVDMVSFHPDDVILERVKGDEVVFSFWICPHRFFRMLVGEATLTRKGELTQDQEWAKLVALFPDAATPNPVLKTVTVETKAPKHILATESTQLAPVTKLKSAESGKRGWMGVAAMLAAVLIVAGLVVFSKSGGEDDLARAAVKDAEFVPPQVVKPVKQEEPVQVVQEEEKLPELEVVSAVPDLEETVVAVSPEWQKIGGAEKNDGIPEGYEVVSEEDEQGLVSVGEVDELEEEMSGEVESVAEPAKARTGSGMLVQSVYTPDQVDELRSMNGEEISMKGVVGRTAQSGGKGTLWYLDFGDYRDEAFVVFKHNSASKPVTRAEWDELVGQEVFVSGTVEIGGQAFNTRGSNVRINVSEFSDVLPIGKLLQESAPAVFSPLQVDELRKLAGQQREITVSGTLGRFVEKDGWRYLVFVEGTAVCARFSSHAPFARDPGFLQWLRKLEGQKVDVRGMVRGNPIPNVDVAIEFDAPDAVAGSTSVD